MKISTEIIVATIGLSGILIPFLYQSYINLILDKPYLDVSLKPENNTVEIQIQNMGFSSAANITLFIYSEETIEYIVNTFSTAQVYLIDPHKNLSNVLDLKEPVSVNDKLLKLEIPEIKQGQGSFVTLMTIGNQSFFPKDNEDMYEVYAIFNQGSTRGEIEKIPLWEQIDALRNFLYNYILNIYFLIPFYFIYALFLIPYISLSRRKRKFQKHINDVIDDLLKFVNFYKEGKFEVNSDWNELIKKNNP